MTLDLSKPVQTRDGRKVRILCTDAKGDFRIAGLIDEGRHEYAATWGMTGRMELGGLSPSDLVNVPEPERTVWLNVYEGGQIIGYDSKEMADLSTCWIVNGSNRQLSRIACAPFKYRPGQGLET
jgi:hypothetical protein